MMEHLFTTMNDYHTRLAKKSDDHGIIRMYFTQPACLLFARYTAHNYHLQRVWCQCISLYIEYTVMEKGPTLIQIQRVPK